MPDICKALFSSCTESFAWSVVQESARRENGIKYHCGSVMWHLRASQSIHSARPACETSVFHPVLVPDW